MHIQYVYMHEDEASIEFHVSTSRYHFSIFCCNKLQIPTVKKKFKFIIIFKLFFSWISRRTPYLIYPTYEL